MLLPRDHLRAQTAFALRRSRKLEELLRELRSSGPLTEVELWGRLRVSRHRLRCILFGDGVLHHPERAAIPLGLVVRERSPRGIEVHLTELGAHEAALVAAARREGRGI